MIEIIDNLLQFIVTFLATICAGILFYKTRKPPYVLLTCFYGTYMLASLYWVVYQMITNYTPQIFYVSDLTWIASFMFLLTLVFSLETPEGRRFRRPIAWLSPIIGGGFMLFFYRYGDYITNTLWCTFTFCSGWFSINGLLFARQQTGKERDKQYFHLSVLSVVIVINALWISSCFWISDTLTNPYFWIDFALTIALASLLPTLRRAVGS